MRTLSGLCFNGFHLPFSVRATRGTSRFLVYDVVDDKVTWAGPGLLAAATGESLVRFWDLSSDKNYVLTLQSGGLDRTDKSTCISFDPIRRCVQATNAFLYS